MMMNEKSEIMMRLESFRCTISYGMAALKALYWLSGGAAAALLVFMGYLVANGYARVVGLLAGPLCSFFLAALLASGSLALSYVSQAHYTHDCEHVGDIFQRLAVVVTVVAFGAAFGGMIYAGVTLVRLW